MYNYWKNLKLKRRFITFLARMHFFGNPSSKMKIVGVTGTNGKTTTTTLLYKVATALGYKSGLIGTVEHIIVDEHIPSVITTPSPIHLYKLLNEMAKKGCEYVFMEVSSHAMDQDRVAGVKFTGGIFTNLTHDHLDYHKTFENYFIAKKKFFTMLPVRAFALANIDDKAGEKMLEGIKAEKHTYGFSGEAEFSEKLETGLIGGFNEYNALAVYAGAVLLGFDKDKVKEALKNITPPRGRFEHFTSPNGVLNIVDYAHTPDALEKAISVARTLKSNVGRLISVFGCGGDRDPSKRKVMGRIGAEGSETVIFTSDNPRTEDPNKIITEMQADLTPELEKKIKIIPDRHEAIREAVRMAQGGDIILLAGKGHETYQDVNGVKNHFDDLEELKKAYAPRTKF